MGKLILRKNGIETQFISGEDFNTLNPELDTYVLGFDAITGKLESLDPDGNNVEYGEGGSTFSGGTVTGPTDFLNTLTASVFSASTYLNLPVVGLTEVTYLELVDKITGGTLTSGAFYLITDFQTCYDQPDYDSNGNPLTGTYKQGPVEPILIFSTSENTISDVAYQPTYPNDKIRYDWTFNQTESTGGIAYGRITERIDEYNNRTSYDHRNVLLKRYKTYFYDLGNPRQGKITMNGGIVTGIDTVFTDLTVGSVIYVHKIGATGFYYKIDSITDDFNMVVIGENYYNDSELYYYIATEEEENSSFNTVPYTHTQMTSPPVNDTSEASFGDFAFDGSVVSSDSIFGTGSSYFTNTYPGLFVMVADNVDIEIFKLDGDLGADGGGNQNVYTYTVGSNEYTAFVKRVYNAGDPSVNEIIIVNTDGTGIIQTIGNDTNSGLHKLENLNGVTRISYLLTSLDNGNTISDLDIDNIVNQYLSLSDGNDINTTLSNLNSNYNTITGILPSQSGPSPRLYYFNDVGNNIIDDGGGDMYDGGNYIYTSFVPTSYKSYEWKSNNIVGDGYSEVTTFRFDLELPIVISKNNYVGDVSGSDFLIPNTSFGSESYGNIIGTNSNNGFSQYTKNNRIDNDCDNNTIRGEFYGNIIGLYFNNNIINGSTWRNKIGEGFEYNQTGRDFQNNTINNQFNNNVIWNNFYKNKIGNGFNQNQIDEFYGNDITNGFYNNRIYQSFYENKISDYFRNNEIYEEFYENLIGLLYEDNFIGNAQRFWRNDIGNDFRNNTIYGEFQNNEIGNQFNNNICGNSVIKNIIGNGFNDNKLSYFDGNKIGHGFNNNILSNDFENNQIGNYFSDNRVSSAYSNVIVDNFQNNRFGEGFGFYDFSDVTTRSYNTFRSSLNNNIGSYIIGRELILQDTVNNEYHKVVFTRWTQGGNGGGFTYRRQKIYPSVEGEVFFERLDYQESTIDVIVPGVLEIKRDNNGGGIYNVAVEGSFNSSVSPTNTVWNSNYTSPTPGNNFGYNQIKNNFSNNSIGSDFGYGGGNSLGNIIGDIFQNNVIGNITYNNVIGNEFRNNVIGNNFENNQIKNYFINNDISNNFESNIIGDYFGNLQTGPGSPLFNTISDNFKYNKIGDYFGNDLNFPSNGSGSGGDGGNYVSSTFQNNVIGNNCVFNIFGLNFTGNKISHYLGLNSFGDTSQDNIIGNYFIGNSGIGGFPTQISDNFSSNKIGNYTLYNEFGDFNTNEIGDLLGNSGGQSNVFYSSTYGNKIGEGFGYSNGNIIFSSFFDNLIGNNFYGNYIGENSMSYSMYRNDIGNDFRNNIVYSEFQNNEIGNQFNNNTCGGDFIKNTIGNGFNYNKLSYFDTNKFGNGVNNNVFNYYVNNNVFGDYVGNNRLSSTSNNVIGVNFNNNRFGDGYGFYDLGDVTTRTYDNFRDALGGGIGGYIIGRELIMYDTISNEYHKVVFTKWTQGGAGGGFKYTRQLVWPSFGPTITFERPDYSPSTTDVIVPGVLEIKRDDNGGGIYNVAVEGSFNGSVSPTNTTWNSMFTSPKAGSNFNNNIIATDFSNNEIIGNNFYYNNISGNFQGSTNILDNFQKNIINCIVSGVDFSSATFVYNNYNCNVFENSSNNVRLSYYDGSDVLNIVNITD